LSFTITYQILIPTLPLYLSRLGSEEVEIGILTGSFFVSALIFRPIVGKALSKIPEKKFMIAGAALFCLTSVAFLFAPPFWPFLFVRILQGVGMALYHTSSYTLIANISPEAHRAQSLTYFLLATNFSLAIAPPAGMFLINHFGFTHLFMTCFGTSLCSLILINSLRRRKVTLPEGFPKGEGFFFHRKALPPSIVNSFAFTIWGALTVFFPLYAVDHGVTNPGVFFTTIAVMIFLCRTFGGKLLDLYGTERVIPFLLASYALSMAVLAFSKTLPMFILVAAIFGVGYALLLPALMALALDRGGSSRGPAMGTFTAVSDLGYGVGPVIMGVIIRFTNYRIMFLCLALTGIMSIIYFHFFARKK
jgi:MFS family permease